MELHGYFPDYILFLETALQVICKQSRYRSVLFHKDCDLVKALSTT